MRAGPRYAERVSVRWAAVMLSTLLVLATSSCAVAGEVTAGGTDLDWLWGLFVVVALFVLGGVAYRIRNPRR